MLSERALRFIAMVQDAYTARFRDAGIDILGRDTDYRPMTEIRSKDLPPIYAGTASKVGRAAVRAAIVRLFWTDTTDLHGKLADAVFDAITTIEVWEHKDRVHWQMCKHVLESYGLFSLHAPHYLDMLEKRSAEVRPLPSKLLALQSRRRTGMRNSSPLRAEPSL